MWWATLVFCYQNCSDLLWEKKCSTDREKLLKFKAEDWEFSKSQGQLIQTVKGQFLKQNAFLLVPGCFLDLIH